MARAKTSAGPPNTLVLLQIRMSSGGVAVRAPGPAVPGLLDEGHVEDHVYRAFPLPLGWTFGQAVHDRREAGSELSPEAAIVLMAGAARAVHTLHEAGLLHLELSPDLIFILEDGQVQLADPGRALPRGATDKFGGRPGYAAPELVRREPLDARTDVYGLGLVLWELLTLEPVFPRVSLPKLIRAQERPHVPPPSKVRPGLPPALDIACLRALDPTPTGRFSAADVLADALSDLLGPGGGTSEVGGLVRALEQRPSGNASLAPYPEVLAAFEERRSHGFAERSPSAPVRPSPSSESPEEDAPRRSRGGLFRWGVATAAALLVGASVGLWLLRQPADRLHVDRFGPGAPPPALEPSVPNSPEPRNPTMVLKNVLQRGRSLARESERPETRRAAEQLANAALIELTAGSARPEVAHRLLAELQTLLDAPKAAAP